MFSLIYDLLGLANIEIFELHLSTVMHFLLFLHQWIELWYFCRCDKSEKFVWLLSNYYKYLEEQGYDDMGKFRCIFMQNGLTSFMSMSIKKIKY